MDILKGKVIGDIHVTVYTTPDNERFFQINADNEDVLPVIDIIEDTLLQY